GPIYMPAFRGHIDQQETSARRYRTQPGTHGWRGAAAESAPIERRQMSVSHHELNRRQRDPEFLCDLLTERSTDVLPHLDLARINRHPAICGNVNPGSNGVRQFFFRMRIRDLSRFL